MSHDPHSGSGMDAARWARLSDVFRAALELPADQRERLVRRECGEDESLALEVLQLLEAHDASDERFLAGLDVGRAAALLDASADAPSAGSRIGPYVIERVLGRGGMAVVYLARDPRLEREVALKLLTPALGASSDARQRLIAEARAASALDHPNIATIYDIGETDEGQVFFAMARYPGETVRDRLARGPLPLEDAVRLGRQIASGLAAAHARGIIHRDVKPANVMVTPDGTAKILDFGIAKATGQDLTRAGATLGTVAYMSPEQTHGDPVDARADVWALGVVLYEMLCGRRPFEGDSDSVVIHAIRNDAAVPVQERRPDAPRWLSDMVDRCLQKQPGQRFAAMDDVIAALDGGRGGAEPAPLPAPARRKIPWLRVAVAVVAIGAATWIGSSLFNRNATPPATSRLLVLPLSTSSPDSALERLGADIAITLARTLDGVAGLHTVDPISVLSRPRDRAPARIAGFAAQMGADRIIEGSLVRDGAGVRVDAVIRAAAESGATIADATVTGAADDITGLTDALAVALVRELLESDGEAIPSLAALTTRSPDALRDYILGEHAIAEGRFVEAAADFERTIAEDSTFWFAYWRLWYARAWNDLPVDSAIITAVAAHVDAFPDADALLARARLAPDERERLALLREATTRHAGLWQTWFDLGDWLHHNGPHHGFTQSDARAAFESALDRNPQLLPALEHLFKIGVLMRDSVLTGNALARMTTMGADSLRAPELRYDILLYYRYLDHLTRTNGVPHAALADTGAAMVAVVRSRSHEELSRGLNIYAFGLAQIDFLDRIVTLRPAPDIARTHLYGRTMAWAQRGAWDSALVSARAFAEGTSPEAPELLPLQIAAIGALLEVIDPDTARILLDRAVDRSGGADPEVTVEITWLQGLVAFSREDTADLRALRERLETQGGAVSDAPVRMVRALETAVAGRRPDAAVGLATLAQDLASQRRYAAVARNHPWLGGVNRILASRWFLEAGDTVSAETLLPWYEVMSTLRRAHDANIALSPFALAERARIAMARGDRTTAARFWTSLLRMLDSPVPALGPLIDGARSALSSDARSSR
ncbi:MAG: protein kinase [Gemmatimonadetes bacterium]|nr:protein kinase [Gemmatimonadota bacterium]